MSEKFDNVCDIRNLPLYTSNKMLEYAGGWMVAVCLNYAWIKQ